MAEKRVVSAFPQPPSFYKNYASEETSRPPPAPLTGIYQVFGEVHNTVCCILFFRKSFCEN